MPKNTGYKPEKPTHLPQLRATPPPPPGGSSNESRSAMEALRAALEAWEETGYRITNVTFSAGEPIPGRRVQRAPFWPSCISAKRTSTSI